MPRLPHHRYGESLKTLGEGEESTEYDIREDVQRNEVLLQHRDSMQGTGAEADIPVSSLSGLSGPGVDFTKLRIDLGPVCCVF